VGRSLSSRMSRVESIFVCLFWASVSISLSVFCNSRFLTLSSMKVLTSSLHSAGFCFIFSLSSRGMRIVMVVDMHASSVTHFVLQHYKSYCAHGMLLTCFGSYCCCCLAVGRVFVVVSL
jgi:hypothetical protein